MTIDKICTTKSQNAVPITNQNGAFSGKPSCCRTFFPGSHNTVILKAMKRAYVLGRRTPEL